jgi:drug/metabolite transporter (DMT)-like permease
VDLLRFHAAPRLPMSTGQLLAGPVRLAALTPFFTSVPVSVLLGPALAIAALGALGTGVAFLLQYGLIAEKGPTIAVMVIYAIPVIATTAGVALLNERLSWNEPVDAVIVPGVPR